MTARKRIPSADLTAAIGSTTEGRHTMSTSTSTKVHTSETPKAEPTKAEPKVAAFVPLVALFGVDPATVTLDLIAEFDTIGKAATVRRSLAVYDYLAGLKADPESQKAGLNAVAERTGLSTGYLFQATQAGRVFNLIGATYPEVEIADGSMIYTVIGRLKSQKAVDALLAEAGRDGQAIVAAFRAAFDAGTKATRKAEPNDGTTKGTDTKTVTESFGYDTMSAMVAAWLVIASKHESLPVGADWPEVADAMTAFVSAQTARFAETITVKPSARRRRAA